MQLKSADAAENMHCKDRKTVFLSAYTGIWSSTVGVNQVQQAIPRARTDGECSGIYFITPQNGEFKKY